MKLQDNSVAANKLIVFLLIIHNLIWERKILKQFKRCAILIIERVLIDAVLPSKQKKGREKMNFLCSLFRENAKASTEGLHGYAVSSFPKNVVICLNDNHSRFEGSWHTRVFCICTFSCSLKEGIKLSKVNMVLQITLLSHVWIFKCETLTRISKVFCVRQNWT